MEALDYETAKKHTVVVVATDTLNRCHKSRALVIVNVIDINDNSPKFDKNSYTASVPENSRAGTQVIKVMLAFLFTCLSMLII